MRSRRVDAERRPGRDRRPGLTVFEGLLAVVLTGLVITLLWSALGLVLRGAGRAEWRGRAERQLEAFHRRLEDEVRRANHLVCLNAAGQLHDPVFSAIWATEAGAALRFRVFGPEPRSEDPVAADPDTFPQDRVAFLAREGRVVYTRRGEVRPEETRVLLEDVASVAFEAADPFEVRGPVGGLLRVRVRLADPAGRGSLAREIVLPTAVPVFAEGAAPAAPPFLPAPAGSGATPDAP